MRCPRRSGFEPLMTLYLTDLTPPREVHPARDAGIVGFKLYPAGATTNSDAGVTDFDRVAPTIEAMEECGLVLLVHGEVTDPEVDIFDREKSLHRSSSRAAASPPRRAEGGLRTRHHQGCGGLRSVVAAENRRDHHAAASSAQPQRHPRRGDQTPPLLSARAQERDPP